MVDEWTDGPPFSRLVIVGDWSDLEVNQLAVRFHRCLLTEDELAHDWHVPEDGFEPWLGPIEPAVQPLPLRTDLP